MYEYVCPVCQERYGTPETANAHRGYELDKFSLDKLLKQAADLDEQVAAIEGRLAEYE